MNKFFNNFKDCLVKKLGGYTKTEYEGYKKYAKWLEKFADVDFAEGYVEDRIFTKPVVVRTCSTVRYCTIGRAFVEPEAQNVSVIGCTFEDTPQCA